MKLVIDMPWGKNLTVKHCNMGPQGNWHLKRGPEGWMDRLGWEVKAARGEYLWATVRGIAHVVVDMRFPDKRKRDTHNYHYLIANGVAAGLGIDDKDIRISTGTVDVDRDNPGFTITVEDEG